MERIVAAHLRSGRPADLDALERLEHEVFDFDRLSRRSLRSFLTAPTTDTAVAENCDGVAGYAMIGFRSGSGIGRLFSLAVRAGMARRGLGQALLEWCEGAARRRGRTRIRLEVRTDNSAAIRLYEKASYVRIGVYEGYYEDGASALRLQKQLAGASQAPDPPSGI